MPTDAEIERGFLAAEEEALKAKLSNIFVTDPKATDGKRRVRTWFGDPTAESDRAYPYIQIDLLDIEPALDRAHSAQVMPIDGWPSEYATFAGYAAAHDIDYASNGTNVPEAVTPHPYNIHFTVTTRARSAEQDRELTRILLGTAFLPHRWGYLHVPADDTQRHLDLVDWSTANYNEGGDGQARVFRKVFHITVSAHLSPELPFLTQQVERVHGEVRETSFDNTMDDWEYPTS